MYPQNITLLLHHLILGVTQTFNKCHKAQEQTSLNTSEHSGAPISPQACAEHTRRVHSLMLCNSQGCGLHREEAQLLGGLVTLWNMVSRQDSTRHHQAKKHCKSLWGCLAGESCLSSSRKEDIWYTAPTTTADASSQQPLPLTGDL